MKESEGEQDTSVMTLRPAFPQPAEWFPPQCSSLFHSFPHSMYALFFSFSFFFSNSGP